MSSTESAKVWYLRSHLSLWSQCTGTCLRILLLARRRRGAHSRQEFLQAAQHMKSTDDCLLATVFCLYICSQELPVSSSVTEVQLVESSLSTPRFDVKLGFQPSKRDSRKIWAFIWKLKSPKELSSHFLALQGSIIFMFGEKCFFWLAEVTILLVSTQYRVLWAIPLGSFWWQCHLVWTTATLMNLHSLTRVQRDIE